MKRIETAYNDDVHLLFDVRDAASDIFMADKALKVFECAADIGVNVVIRMEYGRLRSKKSSLEILCGQGLVDEVRIHDGGGRLAKGGLFQRLARHHPDLVRRLAVEVDIFAHMPTLLDELVKPMLPEERRDRPIDFTFARTLRMPKVCLVASGEVDVFSKAFEERVETWKAELPWIAEHVRVSFDEDAYRILSPERIANLTRSRERRKPVFFVSKIE